MKKTVNVEAKASLQPHFRAKKIDFIYLKGYKLLAKKDKDKVYWKH